MRNNPNVHQLVKGLNKTRSVHTLECSSAIEKMKIPLCAIIWMNLKNIMLSERCQIQKTKNCMIPFV